MIIECAFIVFSLGLALHVILRKSCEWDHLQE